MKTGVTPGEVNEIEVTGMVVDIKTAEMRHMIGTEITTGIVVTEIVMMVIETADARTAVTEGANHATMTTEIDAATALNEEKVEIVIVMTLAETETPGETTITDPEETLIETKTDMKEAEGEKAVEKKKKSNQRKF